MLDYLAYVLELWRTRVRLRLEKFGDVLSGGLLLGSALLFTILGYSPQVHELFKVLLEADNPITLQAVLAAASMMILSAMLFFTYQYFLPYLGPDGDYHNIWLQRIAYLGLYGIAAAPWLACAASVYSMRLELIAASAGLGELLSEAGQKAQGEAALALMARVADRAPYAIAVIALLCAVTLLLLNKSMTRRLWRVRSRARFAVNAAAALILLFFGVAPALFDFTLTSTYQFMGPLAAGMTTAISLFALGLAASWLARMSGLASYFGILILILIGAAGTAIVSYSGRFYEVPKEKGAAPLAFGEAAGAWIKARRTALPAQLPVPLFVVSAQGGGMYAATASALFLSRLQDKEPGFKDSIFALSAVSGGAAGAGFFDALSSPGGCEKKTMAGGKIQDAVPGLLLTPYLAPVAGNAAADVLRKFVSIFAYRKDRGDAFTETLLENCPVLAKHYASHWSPDGHGPALVLNTTWMSNGYRVAFAPFSLRAAGDGTLWSMSDVYEEQKAWRRGKEFQPAIADAIAASARFPGALPPLSLTMGTARHNYGDGGYADASGVTTALEMFDEVRRIVDRDYEQAHVEPRLIIITFDYRPVEPSREDGTLFVDTVAPVDAILGVRYNEAEKAITRAEKRGRQLESGRFLRVSIEPEKFGIALGLQISRTSFEVLSL